MKNKLAILYLLFAFAQTKVSAQTFYLNKEIVFYEDDDSINAEVITRQFFDTLGRLVYQENVGWDKTWFYYNDTFLVSKIRVEPSDSMDNLAEKTFRHFYNDTTIYFYKNTFNKKGQLIYRSDSIRKFTARKPSGCVRYQDEIFDYTRIWIDFKDSKTIEYDSMGRLISEKSADEKRSWKYDSLGRLIERFERGTTQLFKYNLKGYLIESIDNYSQKADTLSSIISFDKELDNQGRVKKETETQQALYRKQIVIITTTFEYKENELIEKKTEKFLEGEMQNIKTFITISKNKRTIASKK